MKKDIYIIKNKINDKVYIGQTGNIEQRWYQYKSLTKKDPNKQLITRAMSKYGFENFSIEIVESQIENYDEREIYWIQHYNSVAPNGYNLAPGGQGTGSGILAPSALIKTEEKLNEIIDEIVQNELPLTTIADKYNLSYRVINTINQGQAYRNNELSYPLRPTKKYDAEFLKQITYSLKYELDKTLQDIAKEYQIDESFLHDINQGKAYYREYLQYPLRVGKMKLFENIGAEIKELLKNSDVPQKDIARKFNVSAMWVSNINTGKTGFDENEEYPLRKGAQGKGKATCLSPNEVQEIIKLLQTSTLSMNKIAQQFNVNSPTIGGINSGKIKKYYQDNIQYPVRKK